MCFNNPHICQGVPYLVLAHEICHPSFQLKKAE